MIGCTMQEIGAVCECSVDTLERRFADIIQKGKETGKSSLRRMQWKNAESGNVTMQIWLGKQLLGQKDMSRFDLSNEDRSLADMFAGAVVSANGLTEAVAQTDGSYSKFNS